MIGSDIMTIHNEAKKEEIAQNVIMPGDPNRAKYIAQKYLKQAQLVNNVRGMKAYTGFYKDKKITVMASGMGMSSIGIYAYELYKFYDVQNIIRVGSCGSYSQDLKLKDIVLTDKAYNEGLFAYTFDNQDCHLVAASEELNKKIMDVAQKMHIPLKKGNTLCVEVFEPYMTNSLEFKKRLPDINLINSEMESFALFYIAKTLSKNAAVLTTVSDDPYTNQTMTIKDRENSFNQMILLALETL